MLNRKVPIRLAKSEIQILLTGRGRHYSERLRQDQQLPQSPQLLQNRSERRVDIHLRGGKVGSEIEVYK